VRGWLRLLSSLAGSCSLTYALTLQLLISIILLIFWIFIFHSLCRISDAIFLIIITTLWRFFRNYCVSDIFHATHLPCFALYLFLGLGSSTYNSWWWCIGISSCWILHSACGVLNFYTICDQSLRWTSSILCTRWGCFRCYCVLWTRIGRMIFYFIISGHLVWSSTIFSGWWCSFNLTAIILSGWLLTVNVSWAI